VHALIVDERGRRGHGRIRVTCLPKTGRSWHTTFRGREVGSGEAAPALAYP